MNKILTGEMIYRTLFALVETGQYCIDSDDVTPPESQIYADLAEKLNEQLGLTKPATLQGGNQFEDCTFILRYSLYMTDRVEANNIETLYDLIKEYVPMPESDQPKRYKIDVMKGGIQKGTGIYERFPISTGVVDEEGAALGLNDALYKFACENA